ncbi:MAG: family 1 encapsulin nanocompartment shell protein [Dehalococcoidales bacterium]
MNPNAASVDIVSAQGGQLVGHGDVATRLMQSDFNIGALRTNAVLRKDEWSQFDAALIEVARQRLPLVTALVGAGLSFPISNGLGTTILEWEQVSDMEPADVSMAGVTRGEQDTLEYTLQSMPLPIIHKDFTINIRKLQASRTLGQPLDTAQAALAGRLVAEATEAMVIDGHATQVGAAVIYGLDTVPNSSAVTMTNLWDTTSAAVEYVEDVLAAIAALQVDHMYGPYALVVNYTAHNRMQNDYVATDITGKTIAQRVSDIEGISTMIASTNVPANTAYVFQLTSDVIDEVVGLQPTTVQWETQGGMQVHFKVMSIMIPRVRWTRTLQSGIAVIS